MEEDGGDEGGEGSFENTFIQRLRNFLSALRRSPLIPRGEGEAGRGGGGGKDRESRRLPPRLNFSRGGEMSPREEISQDRERRRERRARQAKGFSGTNVKTNDSGCKAGSRGKGREGTRLQGWLQPPPGR